jgi:hypothetical protein
VNDFTAMTVLLKMGAKQRNFATANGGRILNLL